MQRKEEEKEREEAKKNGLPDIPPNPIHEKDQDLREEIEKDIKRTRNEVGWFVRPVEEREFTEEEEEQIQAQATSKWNELTEEQQANHIETHADVLTRILFIYAKLNPGL